MPDGKARTVLLHLRLVDGVVSVVKTSEFAAIAKGPRKVTRTHGTIHVSDAAGVRVASSPVEFHYAVSAGLPDPETGQLRRHTAGDPEAFVRFVDHGQAVHLNLVGRPTKDPLPGAEGEGGQSPMAVFSQEIKWSR
jgi:hypothetical protein